MAPQAPHVVFGTAGIAHMATDVSTEMLEILERHNVNQLDTASIYVSLHRRDRKFPN